MQLSPFEIRAGMKGRKLIFLISALVLPVAIFLFLKLFGRNEFQVPPLHQNDEIDAPAECGYRYATPYTVPDSIADNLRIDSRDSLYVVWFNPADSVPMKRVSVEYAHAPVRLIHPATLHDGTDVNVLQRCVLLMKAPASVVMIDHRRRIRGYYDGSDRDDIDRLLVEIDIILKNY